ncbi:MAG TPA: MFS transporter [Mycobacteriales bacterium]|nr:MFS transporter [Mycobacteriales bacterium]
MPLIQRGRRDAAAVPVYLLLAGGSAGLFALVSTLNLVYQATVVGLSPLELVLVGTVLEAVVFVAEIPTGVVADIYSRRLSILIGLVLVGSGWVLEGSVPRFLAVLAAQVLWGVGFTFTSGATEAWIADEVGDDDEVARVFIRGTKAGQAGTIGGILVAGGLGLVWIRLPIIAGGVGFLVLAGVLMLIMPERNFRPVRDADRAGFGQLTDQVRAGVALARRRRLVRTLMLISLVSGLASEAFDRLWTVHLLNSFHFPSVFGVSNEIVWFTAIGLVGTVLSLVTAAVVTRVSPRTLTALHPRGLMAGLAAVQVLTAAVFAVAGQFGVALAMLWLRAVAGVLAGPVSSAWMNRQLEPGVRATVLSIESQLNAVGQVAGGPVLGWVGSAVSVRVALLASAATLSPVIGLYTRAKSEMPVSEPNAP